MALTPRERENGVATVVCRTPPGGDSESRNLPQDALNFSLEAALQIHSFPWYHHGGKYSRFRETVYREDFYEREAVFTLSPAFTVAVKRNDSVNWRPTMNINVSPLLPAPPKTRARRPWRARPNAAH